MQPFPFKMEPSKLAPSKLVASQTRVHLLLWLACFSLMACGAPRVSLERKEHTFEAEDYWEAYERWTREQRAFSLRHMRDMLAVTATFESWEFRWAYVTRFASDYSLTRKEKQEALTTSLQDARKHHRFFVTMAGSVYREADLTDRSASWRVLLMSPKHRTAIEPEAIERISRPTALVKTYFPSISSQRWAFRISFPVEVDGQPTLPADADKAVLRFSSAEGKVDLVWDLIH